MEALNQQIVAMNREDSLSKMRSQQETIMATLRQKHEEEILLLKEKLDDTKKELNWKVSNWFAIQNSSSDASSLTSPNSFDIFLMDKFINLIVQN